MAPTPSAESRLLKRTDSQSGHDKASLSTAGEILEAWAGGYMVGSLVILMLIVLCNFRRHVLLHKLILLEMLLALWHGTFIFLDDPIYGWYLSSTALLLFISYQVHNVVTFLKIRPFLPKWGRLVFLVTLAAVQPYWVIEAWDNFEYFNGSINWNVYTRPWEALARDPWWIFTTCFLIYKIKVQYEFTLMSLLSTSPRLIIMILCMILSIAFLLADTIVTAGSLDPDSGIDPYWRLTLVFKRAADTIFLDDFKSVLDSIVAKRFSEFRFIGSDAPVGGPRRNAYRGSNLLASDDMSPTAVRPAPPHLPGVLCDAGNISGGTEGSLGGNSTVGYGGNDEMTETGKGSYAPSQSSRAGGLDFGLVVGVEDGLPRVQHVERVETGSRELRLGDLDTCEPTMTTLPRALGRSVSD